jgi:DNA repair protein SbcC/Rad50
MSSAVSPKYSSDVEAVLEYLHGVQGAELAIEPAPSDGDSASPLILFSHNSNLAAFAFLREPLSKDYELLYSHFKKLYVNRQGAWKNKDISFVLCVDPKAENLETFSSSVETDVFFCRKLVILLKQGLYSSAPRLPFLPLGRGKTYSFRPPSAQSFLRQCGVPVELSKLLAVRHQRAADKIIDDCTQGKFGAPGELVESADTEIRADEERQSNLRVGSLEIQNFRAYRKRQVFDLSADITVLYGPNGFGKTSFFDAMDFVSTGDIGRLACSAGAKFVKAAKHLDSGNEDSFVALSFTEPDGTSTISRSVDDAANARLDDKVVNRKTALSRLTQSSLSQSDGVQHFLRLFRATHLFSQEHQELLADFQKNCQLDEAVVSRLLSLEDYASAVNKAAQICELLRRAASQNEDEHTLLSGRVDDAKQQLASLAGSSPPASAHATLEDELISLRKEIRNAGISIEDGALDVPTLRSWRARLEMSQSSTNDRMNTLSSLIDSARALIPHGETTQDLDSRLKKMQIESDDHERKTANVQELLQESENRLAEARSGLSLTNTTVQGLKWVSEVRPRYLDLRRQEKALNDQIITLSKAADESMARYEESSAAIKQLEKDVAKVVYAQSAMRGTIDVIKGLQSKVGQWRSNAAELADLVKTATAAKTASESARKKVETAQQEIDGLRRNQAQLQQVVDRTDQNHTQFRRLVSQLQTHITDSLCPLCGVDHGSRDQLLADIEAFVERDGAASTREQLSLLGVRLAALEAALAKDKQQLQVAEEESRRIQRTHEEVANRNAGIVAALNAAGLDTDFTGASIDTALEARLAQVELDATMATEKYDEIQNQLTLWRPHLAELDTTSTRAQGEYSQAMADLQVVKTSIEVLDEDSRTSYARLDVEGSVVDDLLNATELQNQALTTRRSSMETSVAQYRSQLVVQKQQGKTLREQISGLHRQQAANEKEIALIAARFAQADVAMSVKGEKLAELVAAEAEKQTKMGALKEMTANMEMALDAATTAAAHTRVVQGLRKDETALETLKGKAELNVRWLKYFEKVRRLLASRQDSSVEKMIQEYGPRASTIQQRLRPVYGFDAIELHAKDSAIDVRVRRVEEELRPTDYFSQSQQQTLVLGLFLTACLSQTWSGMSAIFLDDPVTHFDDLNTYSFLDLILGLREFGFDQRQFVISTCDEKVLQLARHKFRHLGNKARFYRFVAIGPNGPVIEETI